MVLQKCVGVVKDEPESCSEACGRTSDDGNDEVNVKVEEAIDIKEENPEATTFPPINMEPEVRLCLCVWCVRDGGGHTQRFLLL
jgi:hypothetical protein